MPVRWRSSTFDKMSYEGAGNQEGNRLPIMTLSVGGYNRMRG